MSIIKTLLLIYVVYCLISFCRVVLKDLIFNEKDRSLIMFDGYKPNFKNLTIAFIMCFATPIINLRNILC